jgi:hypothetical protein
MILLGDYMRFSILLLTLLFPIQSFGALKKCCSDNLGCDSYGSCSASDCCAVHVTPSASQSTVMCGTMGGGSRCLMGNDVNKASTRLGKLPLVILNGKKTIILKD